MPHFFDHRKSCHASIAHERAGELLYRNLEWLCRSRLAQPGAFFFDGGDFPALHCWRPVYESFIGGTQLWSSTMSQYKHKRSRLGLTKALKIITKSNNTFKVYGDSIGAATGAAVKIVLVTGKHHDWGHATFANDGDHAIQITAYCFERHSNPDDDLTVTIILDPNTTNQDLTTITYPDAEYDDAP